MSVLLWFRMLIIGGLLLLPIIFIVMGAWFSKGRKGIGKSVISVIAFSWALYSIFADVIFFFVFFIGGAKQAADFVQAVFWFVVVAAGAAAVGTFFFINYCFENEGDRDIDSEEKMMGLLQTYKWGFVILAYVAWGTFWVTRPFVMVYWPQ